MARVIKTTFHIVVYVFALIGFVLTGGFFAVRYGLTNVEGEVDTKSPQYEAIYNQTKNIPSDKQESLQSKEVSERKLLCRIDVLSDYAPVNAEKILSLYEKTYDKTMTEKMLFAVDLRLDQNSDYVKKKNSCDSAATYNNVVFSGLKNKITSSSNKSNIFPWINDESWNTVIAAISKDKNKILSASENADIDPRLVVSSCIVEQLRLYHTQREVYEKVFKPLQILGNANQMAWGVMSIKEKTAIQIENNLKDSSSPYYLGPKYEKLLDFGTDNPSEERYQRLTNDKDHYYSYLYGALYLKEFMAQWKTLGYPIDDRPEIIGTLFNLGFEHSAPKAHPEVGGSIIEMPDAKYTFGSLAYEFFYSSELSADYSLK